MKFRVGVLTNNVFQHLRCDLLDATLGSISVAFDQLPVVLSNSSSDGTVDYVRAQLGRQHARLVLDYQAPDGNSSPGRGENELVKELLRDCDLDEDYGGTPPYITVLSDDDMKWAPDAGARLARIWEAAPADLVVVAGLLEPDWPWNTPHEALTLGCERVLVRDSCPCAAWTFRANDWCHFGPFLEDFGQDVDACRRLRRDGFRVAQADLSRHLGHGRSSWGNIAADTAKPLDRAAWGL